MSFGTLWYVWRLVYRFVHKPEAVLLRWFCRQKPAFNVADLYDLNAEIGSRNIAEISGRNFSTPTSYSGAIYLRSGNWNCRLSCVTGDGGGSCTNCGVGRDSVGLCARCHSLPVCKSCHRRLSENCFNSVEDRICQVFVIIIIIIILSYLFICIFCRLLRSVHALFFPVCYVFRRASANVADLASTAPSTKSSPKSTSPRIPPTCLSKCSSTVNANTWYKPSESTPTASGTRLLSCHHILFYFIFFVFNTV